MDWKTVAEKIIQDDQNKWDRRVSGVELRVSERGALELGNGAEGPYSLSEVLQTKCARSLRYPLNIIRACRMR